MLPGIVGSRPTRGAGRVAIGSDQVSARALAGDVSRTRSSAPTADMADALAGAYRPTGLGPMADALAGDMQYM